MSTERKIFITPTITLDEREIHEAFIRSSGPGGQHVNKTSTAVQLRFKPLESASLPVDVARRLLELAGSRATKDGVVVITSQNHRSQALNRDDALARLVALVRRASVRPKTRVPTRATKASRERRLRNKAHRSDVKTLRSRVSSHD